MSSDDTPIVEASSKRSRSFTYQFMAILVLILIALMHTQPAVAANNAFEQAFAASYNEPDNIDAALHYAEEAVNIGDYESAIPPLERILMFNPSLTNVRLEVGILYYLLESDDMARRHLSDVAKDTRSSAAAQARAKQYLAKL